VTRGALGHRTLIVFVKHPTPGAVKTRLVPLLGAETAAALYRALVEHVLEATSPQATDYERLVFYDPAQTASAMRQWLVGGRLRQQRGDSLGGRMAEAFVRAFARGAGRVVLAGSDVPSLGRADVAAAFSALDGADVVLGPALDGGYYLVGLTAPQGGLFERIEWSTARVLPQTLERAAAAGLKVAQLEPKSDVDTPADLRAAWADVLPALRRDPELRAELERALAREAGAQAAAAGGPGGEGR
jgi:rSAM/selenodomain-associated transferase 1